MRKTRTQGSTLEDEEDEDEDGGQPHERPAAHGTREDYLAVARSVADKFIIRCLMDDALRPFYDSSERLMSLKAQVVEVLFVVLRFGGTAGAARISLDAHRELSDDHLGRLRAHLKGAAREHALHAQGATREADAEALVTQLSSNPDIVLSLLPKANQSGEAQQQGTALARKGAGEVQAVVGGMEFAPLKVPMKRRRQMVGCMIGCGLLPSAVLLQLLLLYYWRVSWPFLAAYLPWALYLDHFPWRGGYPPWPWLRRCWLCRQFADYFPASLIKADPSSDFSGARPVLMGYHPHGILSFGALINFGSDVTGWAEKFPDLTPRLVTLNLNVKLPFSREFILRLGLISAARNAIKKALRPGNAVIIVVGGAAEALDTKAGEYVLTLSRRTGFFRLALEHGADLVPSFGFGENDIFETVAKQGSLLHRLQSKAYKYMSFSVPIFYGRNVFTYNMGLLPYRRPLTVVVGKPIRVEKNATPTKEDIEEVRSQYIKALRQLYEEWQPRLEPGRETPLIVT